jgi:hypothetical protein
MPSIKIEVVKTENTRIQVTLEDGVIGYRLANPPLRNSEPPSISVVCLPNVSVEYYTEDRGEGRWIVIITQVVSR